MINLIPTTAKKQVIIEYWVRTISAWAFLGGTALLLMVSLFIPLNIHVTGQERYFSSLLAESESEQTSYKEKSNLLQKANQQAALLLQVKEEYTLYELLPRLWEYAGEGVELEEVSINQVSSPTVSVGGTAQTRQSLVAFRDALERQEDFVAVELPISNLIKESDVPFVILIQVATSTPIQ